MLSKKSVAALVNLLLVQLIALIPSLSAAQPQVSLTSDHEFGGLICPSLITFTCIATGTDILEWRRNDELVTHFISTSDPGSSTLPTGDFKVVLVSVNETTRFFESTLIANQSSLNNGDRIVCAGSGNISQPVNIDYTGDRSAPPVPDFSHSINPGLRDGLVDVTLSLEDSFISTYAVERYCVRSSDEATCPQQCVESGTPFSCPGFVAGGEYRFWVTAFSCGDQEGEESQPLVVRPQVPDRPVVSDVVAAYQTSAADSALLQLEVMWNPVAEIQLTDQVLAPNVYRVTVEGSTGDVMIKNVTCAQSEGTCSAVFPRLEAADYRVSISVRNVVGESNTTLYPNVIFAASTSYYDPDFSFVISGVFLGLTGLHQVWGPLWD